MTIMVALVAVAGLCVYKTYQDYKADKESDLVMQNIEALTGDDTSDDWSDCPRDKYVRNAAEAWKAYKAEYKAGVGVYIKVNGKKIKLGPDVTVGGTVFVPICKYSKGNCCNKKHLDKSYRYA